VAGVWRDVAGVWRDVAGMWRDLCTEYASPRMKPSTVRWVVGHVALPGSMRNEHTNLAGKH
jgi:hypothetical protein